LGVGQLTNGGPPVWGLDSLQLLVLQFGGWTAYK